MRAIGFASLVTLAFAVFAGCAIDGSQSSQTTDDDKTTAAEESLSTPRPGFFHIQFGIIGYAGGCFKGPGICSIGASSPWDFDAKGTFDANGTVSLAFASAALPPEVLAEGGLKIGAPIALDAKVARSLKAPEGLAIQPGFYSVRKEAETKGSVVIDVKVAPVLGTADWAAPAGADEIFVYGQRVANSDNRLDWVGRLHNKAMRYGRYQLPTGSTPASVDETTAKFLASEGIKLDTTRFFSSGVNKLAAELFKSDAPGELLAKSGKLSPRAASYYTKILDASVKSALAGDFKVNKAVELEVVSDGSLTEQESDVLLATSAVGRYSAAYVISTGLTGGPDAKEAPPIVKADVSGAIGGGVSGAIGGAVTVPVVGAVPGWVAGAVLGGVGASLGEWVSSWF